MFPRSWFLVVVLLVLLSSLVSPWRRRRRRRAPPPPPVNCRVSSWSSWGSCSEKCKIGTHTRSRTITTEPAYGGAGCPTLKEVDGCGKVNGGCGDKCIEKDGTCVCVTKPGYELQGDGKSCADRNECSDGSATCINSKCKNTDGSYECECFSGYQKPLSNSRQCEPKSCTPLTAPQCPADAYRDEFGKTCMPVRITCPDGYQYQKSCTLTCPDNYKLAVITQPNFGQKFAENFTTVDFGSPGDKTVCTVDSKSGAVLWDWNPVTTPYYCRRVNDPPLGVTISKTVINEKQSFLTSVGKLSATDPQKDHLTFSILNPEGNYYFLIQGHMLLVKTRLVWNPNLGDNTYSVVVNVSDNGSPMMHSKATLNITVLNINDPPYALELSNNEISENVPINYTVGNLTAIDDDVGPWRISNFSWEIVDTDNGFFKLLSNEILVAKSLDHESKDIHKIQVRCTDYGIPRRSSQVFSMFIIVRDSNDSPKYLNLTNHRVLENSPVGMEIGEIVARDDDNDTLVFDLNGTDRRILRKFALKGSASCGLRLQDGKYMQTCSVPLVVKESLDYEEENEYIIWVAVTDPGGVTRKRFRIEVENVNERSTDILISDDRVPENSPAGTVVGEFLVKDPDNKNGITQSHTCSLVNSLSGDEDAFYISQTDQRNLLRVKANRILDFESKKTYNITVFCKDTNLGISKSFLIEITDVNEPPTSLFLSNTSVNESESKLIYIATLSAEDPEGTNQTFTYTVRGSQTFRIGRTNQLFFLGPLDFEHTPSISVNVRVTDNGGLYLEKIFPIMVEDVNDPPTDIRLKAGAKLSENSVQNIFIGQVEMIDQDSNTKASCRLLNTSNDRVTLTSTTTLVVGPTNTDYESLDSFKSLQILVRCEDQYGASVTRWINLPVEDVNEVPTNLTLSKLEIRENKNGTVVGILEITDPDVGQRHNCTILDDETPFYIDSSTNTLRTARPLDFEFSRVEYVNIKCEDIVPDGSQAQHFTDKQFKIDVIDVNEVPQVLCNTPFYASPSFSRGSVLGQIRNYDPDNEHYHLSKKQNPNGPFEIRKQLLSYRFENENITWPFDITQNGILYLEKQLTAEEYNGSIIFGIRVDDDGAVWERSSGSEKYQIKLDEIKYSVQNCSVLITSSETEIDIHLSSNTIPENATYDTIIGNLSRRPLLEHEEISYHILEDENGTQPFKIEQNILKLKLGNSLDYELLPAEKTIPITITSVASISGVFTKRFLIKILDVNEMPTTICLTNPRPLDDCSVVGHILIEDLDYPELQCGSSVTIHLEKYSSKLSEYTCHIEEGVDTLSNEVIVDKHFYIQGSPPLLYANKTIFTHGDTSYDVPIVCRSTKNPLHILSVTLDVNIKVPDDANCRHGDLCVLCPEPSYCLTHVKAAGKCVGEDYRINSTVNIPVSLFEKPGFIAMFENYVTSLIEGTSQGKTLTQLVKDFTDENESSRRRREAQYSDVYVEQFVYIGQGTSTNVVFAVAEKPNYNLIPASAACELLKNTEVKCLNDDDGNSSAGTGDGNGESGFPLWIIYIIAALIVVAFIIVLIVIRRRRAKKNDNLATIHFARDGNSVTVGSMYETPDDVRDPSSLSHSGTSNPVLVEKRKDIKVFHNPTYRSQASIKDSDNETEETEASKRRTMNQYETTEPVPVYETIDDDLYEKVNEEKMKENEAADTDTKRGNNSRKKSRSNPVYDIGNDDDSLNPVVNLAVTSPSRKVRKDGDVFPPVHEENDESDDSLSTQILSTFQAQNKPQHSYENVGMVNPLALHTDNVGEEDFPKPPVEVENGPLNHQDSVEMNSDDGQPGKEDSKHPIDFKNELYPLEHQSSFEVNDYQVPQSPPPVYDNNELYSLEKQMTPDEAGEHSSC